MGWFWGFALGRCCGVAVCVWGGHVGTEPPWPPRVTRGGGDFGVGAWFLGVHLHAWEGSEGFVCIIGGGAGAGLHAGGGPRGAPYIAPCRAAPAPLRQRGPRGRGLKEQRCRGGEGLRRGAPRGEAPRGEGPGGARRPQGSEAPASPPQGPAAEPQRPLPPVVPPKKKKNKTNQKKKQNHPKLQHESHQPGEVRQELLRGRVLPVGAELGHRPWQQQQEPGAGGAHEPPVRHERLLLQAAGAGAGHPAGHQGEPGGDPPARHRLHLRPADRAGGGGQGSRPVLGGHPAVPQGGRAGLRALLQRRERSVPLTPPPAAVPISKHAASVGS